MIHIFIAVMLISSPNPMFDHSLESSHQDESIKWSNKGFDEEITPVESIEVHFKHFILRSATHHKYKVYFLNERLLIKYFLVLMA